MPHDVTNQSCSLTTTNTTTTKKNQTQKNTTNFVAAAVAFVWLLRFFSCSQNVRWSDTRASFFFSLTPCSISFFISPWICIHTPTNLVKISTSFFKNIILFGLASILFSFLLFYSALIQFYSDYIYWILLLCRYISALEKITNFLRWTLVWKHVILELNETEHTLELTSLQMNKKSVIITMNIIVYVLHTVWWEQKHKNPRQIRKNLLLISREREKNDPHTFTICIFILIEYCLNCSRKLALSQYIPSQKWAAF